MPRRAFIPIALAVMALTGCDMVQNTLGIESPERVAASRDAEGKAIGGACRNANRAIEDCFTLNKKADKAAVFAGWREMNDYMRENKMDPVAPQIPAAAPSAVAGDDANSGDAAAGGDSPTKGAKPAGKTAGAKKAKGQEG